MSALARQVRTPDGLSDFTLQHDLFLALDDWTALGAVADLMARAGADVVGLQLTRSGEGYGARCRLGRLSEAGARALSETLLDSGLAARASVEHLVLRSCAP